MGILFPLSPKKKQETTMPQSRARLDLLARRFLLAA
jgi:hypothetical protein